MAKNTENMILKVFEIYHTQEKDITPLIEMGMNENSAKDSIRCYGKLIKGELHTRSVPIILVKVILRELYEKNDRERLANVLMAFDKKYEFRHKEYNELNREARTIVDEYKKRLSAMKNEQAISYPDEIHDSSKESLKEGAKKQVVVNAYERNLVARKECLNFYGHNCYICGFNFVKFYGNIGENFIHVHHLKLLSDIKEEYEINPIEDLRPVCPNCHAMLHTKKPPLKIEELKRLTTCHST